MLSVHEQQFTYHSLQTTYFYSFQMDKLSPDSVCVMWIQPVRCAPVKKQSPRKTFVYRQRQNETEPNFRTYLYISDRTPYPANFIKIPDMDQQTYRKSRKKIFYNSRDREFLPGDCSYWWPSP